MHLLGIDKHALELTPSSTNSGISFMKLSFATCSTEVPRICEGKYYCEGCNYFDLEIFLHHYWF